MREDRGNKEPQKNTAADGYHAYCCELNTEWSAIKMQAIQSVDKPCFVIPSLSTTVVDWNPMKGAL